MNVKIDIKQQVLNSTNNLQNSNKNTQFIKDEGLSASEIFIKDFKHIYLQFKNSKFIKKGKIKNKIEIDENFHLNKLNLISNLNNLIETKFQQFDTFTKAYDDIINNDIKYAEYLTKKKILEERLSKLEIVDVTNFSFIKIPTSFSVYQDEIKKTEALEISKKLKIENKNSRSRIVKEIEYSFSDDSLDYDLMPNLCHSSKDNKVDYKNMDYINDILSKSKTSSEINTQIRLNKTNMVKIKSVLEKDFKSVLLMIKYLNINEIN